MRNKLFVGGTFAKERRRCDDHCTLLVSTHEAAAIVFELAGALPGETFFRTQVTPLVTTPMDISVLLLLSGRQYTIGR